MIKTKIEIGQTSENRLTYEEALLYCFSLNINGKIGWRLPTFAEINGDTAFVWNVNDKNNRYLRWHVIPVRDLKDD